MNIITDLPKNMRNRVVLADSVLMDTPCWAWTGALQSKGYGSVSIGNGRTALTHRVAYALLVGIIPADLQIDHLCRNTACCNPAHLEPVTQKVNNERSARATKTHCVHGHALSGRNLIVKTRPNGLTIRNCRVCQLASQRRRAVRAEHREQASA